MKQKDPLGHFEQLVLSAVLSLGRNAYPVTIHDAVNRTDQREVSLGSVYITLERLEGKGYLQSRLGDPTPERGGRPKRFYRVLAAGERVLAEAFEATDRMRANVKDSWRFVKWLQKEPLQEDPVKESPATKEPLEGTT
jgi:DNA-binding PadR family transcriptional regulator